MCRALNKMAEGPLFKAVRNGDAKVSVCVMRTTGWLHIIPRPCIHSPQPPHPPCIPTSSSPIYLSSVTRRNTHTFIYTIINKFAHAHTSMHAQSTNTLLSRIFTHVHTQTHALTQSHPLLLSHTHLSKSNNCWPQASNPMPKELVWSVCFGEG